MDVARLQDRGMSTLTPFSEARKHGNESDTLLRA